jgi:hypothetical protein
MYRSRTCETVSIEMLRAQVGSFTPRVVTAHPPDGTDE